MVTFIFPGSISSLSTLQGPLDGDGNGRLTLDAAERENRNRKVTLTKHPVEVKSKPTDHAELEPQTFSVVGIISNAPLADADQDSRGLDAKTPLDGSYVKAAQDLLDDIHDARQPIAIATEMNHYENMVMTSLDMPRDASTGQSIQFTAAFEEIRFVQTQTVHLQPPTTKVPKKVAGSEQQGKKVATQATDEEVSWSEDALEAFGADPSAARVSGSH